MKKINTQLGFTLIETLVAIAILMVAIAGPLNIAEKGLTTAVTSRDQVVASYLAEDLLEFVKNVRDDNLEAKRPWLNSLTGCTLSNPCIAETATGDPNNPGVSVAHQDSANGTLCDFVSSSVTLGNACRLYIDTQHNPGGYYTYNSSGNQSTQFYRTFYITSLGDGDTALLSVSVYWANGTILNHVIEQTLIFNTTR